MASGEDEFPGPVVCVDSSLDIRKKFGCALDFVQDAAVWKTFKVEIDNPVPKTIRDGVIPSSVCREPDATMLRTLGSSETGGS